MSDKVLKRNSAARKTATKRKSSVLTPVKDNLKRPCEDEVRELANELYQARIIMGEDGNDVDDWLLAEAKLSDIDND